MSMSFSAKRWAYSDMPSVFSQSAICCTAAPSPALLDRQQVQFIPAAASLKGLSGRPDVLASLLAMPTR
jgi:hypothetical protein